MGTIASAAILAVLCATQLTAGDQTWIFTAEYEDSKFAAETETLPARTRAELVYAPDEVGGGIVLDGFQNQFTIAAHAKDALDVLPEESFSVAAWVTIETPQQWGGIVGCIHDDGDSEKGWLLGYNGDKFTLALSTKGADDGDGRMHYFESGKVQYESGRWHHVVATYDGEIVRLYVDGELASEHEGQSGPILYDENTSFVIGAYRDANEFYPHDGRLREIRITRNVMSAEAIRSQHASQANLNELKPWTDATFDWLVEPFLTWPTENAVSVTCETTFPSTVSLDVFCEDGNPFQNRKLAKSGRLHQFRARDLEANTKYFYRVTATSDDNDKLESELLSFRTAATPDSPFTFVVIGDTQSQADVVKRVSDLAFMHRPNLLIHAGDLVSTGTNKSDWTRHFFPNMQPLLSRVPMMPVLGNHEQDAQHYYDYMDLPEPERWYSFKYGNAEFFMIDGNRTLGEGSEQLAWLDGALKKSKSQWKFAVLHQPPYTSDSDDYGDTFKTTSRRGDPNVQNIIALLEKYHVDICFSGHVHDYERTWPIRNGKVVSFKKGGVHYVTSAGGGGHLENFDPANTWFGHKKARYHHLVYIGINGSILEFQAIDENGRLFDVLELRK